MIEWHYLPRREIERSKPYDGTEVLLAVPNRLGTAHGGDGTRLNPAFPYLFYIATWQDRDGLNSWETTESDSDGSPVFLDEHDPCRWAWLNGPVEP